MTGSKWIVGQVLLLLLCAKAAPSATLLDYSPLATGGSGNTDYSNYSVSQNFAERIRFSAPVLLTGMDIYSDDFYDLEYYGNYFPPRYPDATIRIRSDASGLPGAILFEFTETLTAIDNEGATAGNNRKYASFTDAIFLEADRDYWIGMSGTSENLGQMGLSTNYYDDARMAQFFGTEFEYLTDAVVLAGDMAFRLHGETAVPEPTSLALLAGLGAMGLIGVTRRKK